MQPWLRNRERCRYVPSVMNNRIRALRYAIPVLLAASGLTRCAPADSFGYAATAQPAPYGYDLNGYDPGYQRDRHHNPG